MKSTLQRLIRIRIASEYDGCALHGVLKLWGNLNQNSLYMSFVFDPDHDITPLRVFLQPEQGEPQSCLLKRVHKESRSVSSGLNKTEFSIVDGIRIMSVEYLVVNDMQEKGCSYG